MRDVSELEAAAITALQEGIPLCERPFEEIGRRCGLSEERVIEWIEKWMANGNARRFGAIFDARRIGFTSSLCNVSVPEEKLQEVATHVVALPGVTHAYVRSWPTELAPDSPGGPRGQHWPNFWFTLAAPAESFQTQFESLQAACPEFPIRALPATKRFKIDVVFHLNTRERDERVEPRPGSTSFTKDQEPPVALSLAQKEIIRVLQGDLPRHPAFFASLAQRLGLTEADLLQTLKQWQSQGVLRRIALLLRHREVGFHANGMCCWDTHPELVQEKGRLLASSPEVTHCYERPWRAEFPFRLYAMIHSDSWRKTQEIFEQLSDMADLPNGQLLFSLKEFKKTSMVFF